MENGKCGFNEFFCSGHRHLIVMTKNLIAVEQTSLLLGISISICCHSGMNALALSVLFCHMEMEQNGKLGYLGDGIKRISCHFTGLSLDEVIDKLRGKGGFLKCEL